MPLIFKSNIWDLLFDSYILSMWCAETFWEGKMRDTAKDTRLKRWITRVNHIPPETFSRKECGYIYETPDGKPIL